MLKSILCDYSDAYILVKETISVAAVAEGGGNNNKEEVFKNCASFTDCISEINNALIDNAKHVNNSIEYSDNYSETLGRLWQYYEPALVNDATTDFLIIIIIITVLFLNLNKE